MCVCHLMLVCVLARSLVPYALSQLIPAEALRSSRAMALRTFSETLRQRGDKLLRYPPPPPRDLAPPPQVRLPFLLGP